MQHYIAQPLKGLVEIKSSPAGGEAHHENILGHVTNISSPIVKEGRQTRVLGLLLKFSPELI